LRRTEAYTEAADAYSRAIDLIGTPEPRHWSLFYSRAICLERAKEWDRAEPDFRTALRLAPDQPMVLNYLGYSFLEMGVNLDEAMALIRRAVEQRPESGHIVDSLAWGYFLLGDYEAALTPMERASLLMPVDPIVTDHLGDVYWAVGRTREAEFQWRRALSFDPEPDLADRIRRKLEIGLDATLAEEGAPSLAERARK
jgi:Flp pilus assembly protein TadD